MLASLSYPAHAQTIRSGEHGKFTRLAFQTPTEVTWGITQESNSVSIEFTPMPQEFDLSNIFERISRDRIEYVESSSSTLDIFLSCNCDIAVKQLPSGYVIIDVAPVSGSNELINAPANDDQDTAPDGRIPLVFEREYTLLGHEIGISEYEHSVRTSPQIEEIRHERLQEQNRQLQVSDGRATDEKKNSSEQFISRTSQTPCQDTAELRAILERAPNEAYDSVAAKVATFDPLSQDSIVALRNTLFSANLSTEGHFLATSYGAIDHWTDLMLRAFDEPFLIRSETKSSECGPEVTLLGLAAGYRFNMISEEGIVEILKLVQDLPLDRKSNLIPRAVQGATSLAMTNLARELKLRITVSDNEIANVASSDLGQNTQELLALDIPFFSASSSSDLDGVALYREIPTSYVRHRIEVDAFRNAIQELDISTARILLDEIPTGLHNDALKKTASDILALHPSEAVILATALLPLRNHASVDVRTGMSQYFRDNGFPEIGDMWSGLDSATNSQEISTPLIIRSEPERKENDGALELTQISTDSRFRDIRTIEEIEEILRRSRELMISTQEILGDGD